MKGLMGWCLNHETALERVRAKAEVIEDELSQLKNQKFTMEKKFDPSEKERKDLEHRMEEMKKVLEGKDKKVKDLKGQLRQAKEKVVREYRDSDALLLQLGSSFLEGFDDALRQARKAHPSLDLSSVELKEPVQAFVVPVASENTDDLIAKDANIGDGESAQAWNVQVQSVVDEAHKPIVEEANQLVNQQKDDNPAQQQLNTFFSFIVIWRTIFIHREQYVNTFL